LAVSMDRMRRIDFLRCGLRGLPSAHAKYHPERARCLPKLLPRTASGGARFLRNAWYVAALERRSPGGGTVPPPRSLGEAVLLYRKRKRYPRRARQPLPASIPPRFTWGKLRGDVVECGYHGLPVRRPPAACVHNPHGGGALPALPRALGCIPSSSANSALWIWMGDPERAEPGSSPGVRLSGSGRLVRSAPGQMLVGANYELEKRQHHGLEPHRVHASACSPPKPFDAA